MPSNDIYRNLGIASNFNLFVIGDTRLNNSCISGRVAIGGDVFLGSCKIGHEFTESSTGANLIVGGKIMVKDSYSYGGGNSVVRDKSNIISYDMLDKDNKKVPILEGNLIDFKQAEEYLKCTSLYLATIKSDTSVFRRDNNLFLEGKNDINIFYIKGNDLEEVGYINIEVPKSSTIIINVDGISIKLEQNIDLNVNGHNPSIQQIETILWNFSQLKYLKIDKMVVGSVLAPWATVDNIVQWGYVIGNLILNNLYSTIYVDNCYFDRELPTYNYCNNKKDTCGIKQYDISLVNQICKKNNNVYLEVTYVDICGHIKLNTSKCIDKSRVIVLLYKDFETKTPIATTYTNDKGCYKFEKLCPGSYIIEAYPQKNSALYNLVKQLKTCFCIK